MTVHVECAATEGQYELGKRIFDAYSKHLGLDLEFQGFSEEMASLQAMYGPPRGCLLLARRGGDYIGAVGLRELEPETAEMKRMFVFPEHQGSGAGRALVEAFIARATELGYRRIRLDSLRSLETALALYRRYGFVETGPYRYNPFPDAVYLERRLP
jgi:GNAT superfamily N-acetyltransferase